MRTVWRRRSAGQHEGCQRGDERDRPHGDQQNPEPGVAAVGLHAAKEEPGWQQYGGRAQAAGRQGGVSPIGKVRHRQAVQHVDDPEQRAVGVCQRPHHAPRLVRDVEVGAHLEAVERLENESQQAEDENGRPSEPEMPPGQILGEVTSVAHGSIDPRTASV